MLTVPAYMTYMNLCLIHVCISVSDDMSCTLFTLVQEATHYPFPLINVYCSSSGKPQTTIVQCAQFNKRLIISSCILFGKHVCLCHQKFIGKQLTVMQSFLLSTPTLKASRLTLFPVLKIWVAWSYTPSEDLMRHKNEHVKKSRASKLLFSALKQWKSNDIPSIDYYYCCILQKIENS